MALGFNRPRWKRVLRRVPLAVATEMVLRMLSVQYRLPWTQSKAMPSGASMSKSITVLWWLESSARSKGALFESKHWASGSEKQNNWKKMYICFSWLAWNLLVDLPLGDIRPVDLLSGHVHVQRHHVLQAGDDPGVLTPVQGHLSDFVAVGEEKICYRTCKKWEWALSLVVPICYTQLLSSPIFKTSCEWHGNTRCIPYSKLCWSDPLMLSPQQIEKDRFKGAVLIICWVEIILTAFLPEWKKTFWKMCVRFS